jgi:hypothetical protein
VHVELINGKLWIQRDGTEHGFARELVVEAVDREHTVLALKFMEIRRHTDQALA